MFDLDNQIFSFPAPNLDSWMSDISNNLFGTVTHTIVGIHHRRLAGYPKYT